MFNGEVVYNSDRVRHFVELEYSRLRPFEKALLTEIKFNIDLAPYIERGEVVEGKMWSASYNNAGRVQFYEPFHIYMNSIEMSKAIYMIKDSFYHELGHAFGNENQGFYNVYYDAGKDCEEFADDFRDHRLKIKHSDLMQTWIAYSDKMFELQQEEELYKNKIINPTYPEKNP